jgi:hypothetical protein
MDLFLYHLVDAIDDARDVTKQLQQKRPQYLETGSFLYEDSQERQDEAQQNQEDFDHGSVFP